MLQSHPKLDSFSLLKPVLRPRIWLYLAKTDTLNQYRRTLLGPFWILLSLIIFSVAMGTVYGKLFSIDFNEYVAYLTTGMIGWNWANAILVTTGMIYTQNASMLTDYPIDKAYLVWSHATSQLIVLLHQLPLVLLFYIIGIIHPNINVLYLIPSLILIFTINLSSGAILGILVNRYRDLARIITSLTIIIMLITPIFWKPEMMNESPRLTYLLNPFYYMVQIIRDPLLSNPPNWYNYTAAGCLAACLLVAASIIHKRYSKFVVFSL